MKKITLSLIGVGVLNLLSGCRPYLGQLPDEARKEFASALTAMQYYTDAYGFGGLSAPLLVEPNEKFKFSPSEATPDAFFRAAQTNINARNADILQSLIGGGQGISATVELLGLQQNQASQSTASRDTNLVAEKQRLLTEAAHRDFQAAMVAAQTIHDPVKRQEAEASAYRALASNLPGPTTAPATATSATTPTSAGTGSMAPNAAGLLGALQAQSLYAQGTPGVSNDMRSALLTAAGDTAINAILALLANPKDAAVFSDKKLLLGVTEVSVNPGWLTRENFSADITSQLKFNQIPAGSSVRDIFFRAKLCNGDEHCKILDKLKTCVQDSLSLDFNNYRKLEPGERIPEYGSDVFRPYLQNGNRHHDIFVAAVSPMSEAQMLDLQSTVQKRREFALRLSMLLTYAGAKGAADSFLNWAQLQQQDTQSRTANVVVNSYSLSGGIFGFHVGPHFGASLVSGTSGKSELGRQSFPALLILGSDKEELRPRVEIWVSKTGDKETKSTVACRLMEPRLELRTTTDWRPLVPHAAMQRLSADKYLRMRHQLNTAEDKLRDCVRPTKKECIVKCCTSVLNTPKLSTEKQELPIETPKAFAASMLSDADVSCFESCRERPEHCPKVAQPLAEDLTEYSSRADMYRARIVGTQYAFTVPFAVLAESLSNLNPDPPPAPPELNEIIPTKVQVAAPSKTATAGTRVELVLLGKGLGKVDRTKIEPVIGKVTWVNGQGAEQATPNAEMVGDSLKLTFRVSGDDAVIVFALPSGDSKVLTPPLAVSVAAAPAPAKSSTISIDRKQKDGSSETYTFSPDVSDDVKKAVLEKDKPRVVTVKKDETTTTPAK